MVWGCQRGCSGATVDHSGDCSGATVDHSGDCSGGTGGCTGTAVVALVGVQGLQWRYSGDTVGIQPGPVPRGWSHTTHHVPYPHTPGTPPHGHQATRTPGHADTRPRRPGEMSEIPKSVTNGCWGKPLSVYKRPPLTCPGLLSLMPGQGFTLSPDRDLPLARTGTKP